MLCGKQCRVPLHPPPLCMQKDSRRAGSRLDSWVDVQLQDALHVQRSAFTTTRRART